MIIKKKLFSIISFILFLTYHSFSQKKIDYYGIYSKQIDSNMAKMISDLYFTQLSELQSFSVSDKRTDILLESIPSPQNLSDSELSFFAEIKQNLENDKWEVRIHLINNLENLDITKTRLYDSFYKILMEQKITLQASLSELLNPNQSGLSQNDLIADRNFQDKKIKNLSTDLLSGTWDGEENINKIIIMRSGRGFVIFNNGASMNIDIKIQNSADSQSVIITQQSKTNASYFPELPRNLALTAAQNAEPISWKFTLSDNNTLTGTKYTLVLKNNQPEYDNVEVSWNRKLTQN